MMMMMIQSGRVKVGVYADGICLSCLVFCFSNGIRAIPGIPVLTRGMG